MATQETRAEHVLEIQRTFQASPEAVFRAWTQAEALTKWLAPSDEFRTKVLELNPKKGGNYRIEMLHPDGSTHVVAGTYTVVEAPRTLAFTWQWQTKEGDPETLVTIELRPSGKATELTLRHERFADAEAKAKHNEGWIGCLSRLEGAL